MIRISESSPAFRALFDSNEPGSLRLYAVLEGNIIGKMWADNPLNPTRGIVQESTFGTIFLSGKFEKPFLSEFIVEQRKNGDVLCGFWPENLQIEQHFPDPQYIGYVLEFEERSPEIDLTAYMQPIPAGREVRAVDRELFEKMQDYQFYLQMFGSVEKVLKEGIGFCLVQADEILCEAFASMSAMGLIEIGVNTREAHWRKGYGTITCAHLLHECEARGYRTYWNCAEQNVASAALARKLGYINQKRYKLFGWF